MRTARCDVAQFHQGIVHQRVFNHVQDTAGNTTLLAIDHRKIPLCPPGSPPWPPSPGGDRCRVCANRPARGRPRGDRRYGGHRRHRGRIIQTGAVAIDGTDIAAVDTAEAIAKQFRGRETIDASGQIVLPGLVNTHTHAPMVLYRGLADDLPLMEWLNNYISPVRGRPPEFVRAGTRLAALEMIESGTTTFATCITSRRRDRRRGDVLA